MKLESAGILIGMRAFGNNDSLARIFTCDHGVMCGMMRWTAGAKKNRPLVGQYGNASWNARLDTQLGTFHWDAEKNLATLIMASPRNLACLNAAFDLIATLLPERAQYPELFQETLDFLAALPAASDASRIYLAWEVNFLRELGYALNLTRCSGCGRTTELTHLSPRTGRAVCASCAAPYIDRLYTLPLGLDTTMRFIDNVCTAQGTPMPASRRVLGKIIKS